MCARLDWWVDFIISAICIKRSGDFGFFSSSGGADLRNELILCYRGLQVYIEWMADGDV